MKISESKCIKCGEQAVAFWPVIDIDIRSFPWCRTCLDKEKIKFLMKLNKWDEQAEDTAEK